ncbi:hypothetical protein CVO77_03645 [Sphingopyxis lindanitolerans]|uniref:Uncharacterized protein n=1 Tax=Sphingopyxis lindanitolerans TaxID=2054227 RepID=A0A2S8B5L1_9SPHN|nr:hypothetical protein [Sphingopyxis lindanitolerans]PQM27675.1 hypothetical protein CVO77_03645 [Sphingopyxis lindanitolerans]
MARVQVPTTPGRSVQVQPLDAPPLRYTEARNFTGEAVERLGQSMGGLAEGLHDLNLRKAEYSAKTGALTFGGIAEKKLHDPEEGLFRLQGKAALDAYEGVLEDLSKEANTISAGLPSPVAKRLFDDNAAARMQSLRQQVGNFVVRERQVFEEETDIALTQNELRDAGRAWDNDEQSEIHLATAASIIAKRANRGRSLEWAQNEIELRESETRRDIGLARVANIGPDAGEAYFEKHRDSFSADDARAVQSGIRIRREAIAADQRRVEAEARAQAAAAKAQERERLETLRTQLETGAGSSADWIALADGYARIGDTSNAAAARAKAGETRVSEVYRGAPLAQIDQDIAELEAKQGRLSPDQASRLNGLRSVREQTASRLSQPGGAMRQEQYATGQVASALDLSDPDSFKSRASFAVAASHRQGGAIEPLFAEDVRRLEGDLHGEAAQRLKVLRTIALFGDPRAIEGAARQLTSQDDGEFRIAATLISSPGGEKLALEVLRGRDALATSAKVFDSGLAQSEFNRMAAPALAGMPPDYSRDVFDAAKSVYAERARQRGATAWDSGIWRGAINAALGGEVKGSVQHGGLSKFGGRWVSIPPGWTGNGVFRRLATMTGPDTGKAAVSDAAMWPDGKTVTVSELRKLTPVRLGGTRYGFRTRAGRLLGTKSGRPYALDIAKLPVRK